MTVHINMDYAHLVLLFLAVGLIAFLYSSVGHAGASGYIATMTLFGLAPTIIRPTALVLNILVASIGAFQFWRAGHFSWRLFWPFALLSIPAAFLCRAAGVSPKRSTANLYSIATGSDRHRSWARTSFGTDWNWRRYFSHAAPVVLPMGTHSTGGRRFGAVHSSEFNRGAGWLFYKGSFNSFAGSFPRRSRGYWGRAWLPPREPAFSESHDLAAAGDCSHHRWS